MARIKLLIKPIVPTKGLFNTAAMRSLRSSFFREQALKVQEELGRPIDADWDIQLFSDGFSVGTNTPKYVYVNNGTAVRYATMSPNFIPQTIPNRLTRGPKRGDVLYVNRKVPRSGIQARNFTGVVASKLPANLSFAFGRFLVRRVVNRSR